MGQSDKTRGVKTHQGASESKEHWAFEAAKRVIERFPDSPLYTCAAGISPSGIVHFGNFRDVMTSFMVLKALQEMGKPVRLLFSWDEYDRFRKVPSDIDSSFNEHIGKPLTSVPDPHGKFESYARRFEKEFEDAMVELGIDVEYRYQTKEYQSGRYDKEIIASLQRRFEIADVLLSFMSDKGKSERELDPVEFREKFYPISVYSRFSGKDNTIVKEYDGSSTITYYCRDSKQEESVDILKDRIVKLAWKIDWPMRWGIESVVFEPGGKDHASPGGSYDVSRVIAEKIFNRPAPVFQGYEFIGIQGLDGKMSGSKGQAVSPSALLDIYEPELLKWLYTRRMPLQSFNLAFDSEILRQYDEFDRERKNFSTGELTGNSAIALSMSFKESSVWTCSNKSPIAFKQAVALGQTVQWDDEKVRELIVGLNQDVDDESLTVRLSKAKAWLEKYNPEQMLSLRCEPHSEYVASMSEISKLHITQLRAFLESKAAKTIEELEKKVYEIPKDATLSDKENAPRQRAFFKDVYQLLLGKDAGPRLSTFLWAVDRSKVLELLKL